MCIDEKFVDELLDEYIKYIKDKHALPFVIWLRHKKKFDYHTISQIYSYMES